MKIKQNCVHCGAKNALYSVSIRDNCKVGRYWTHSDKTAFYICKKCGYHDEFSLNRIISNAGVYWAYFIEKEDIKKIKEIDTKNLRECHYCKSKTKPPNPQENEIPHPAIVKLYFKKPKRRFLGYFCVVCRRAYYLPIKIIQWEKSEFFKQKESVELLNPLNSYFRDQIRENHPLYNKNKGIIEGKRVMDIIGNFITTKGLSFGSVTPMYTIQIPKSKVKRILNYLENRGCTIIR